MRRHTEDEIVETIMRLYDGRRVYVMSPVVRDRKGHYRELLRTFAERGYAQVRVDGEIMDL